MNKADAEAAAEAARLAEPAFFYRIAVRLASRGSSDYVCVCYATRDRYYVAKTPAMVANASRCMVDSVKRPEPA